MFDSSDSGEMQSALEPDATSVVTDSVFDQPAETRTVRLLFAEGYLDDGGRREAMRWLLGPLEWWRWIEKALLFLGLLLMRAGVVCFIAWNWSDMAPLLKLALIEAGILGACGFALWKGLDSLVGKAAQTAAAALVGVFLAVFGQIYQTGADAYQLFVGWAVLILPWVVLARFDALWVLWIGLVNVAIGLAWAQLIDPRHSQMEGLAIVIAAVNGTAAGLRELGHQRGCLWLKANWVRWLLVPATLLPLLAPTLTLIFDGPDKPMRLIGALCFGTAVAVTYGFHRYRVRDLFVLTVVVSCVCVVVDSAIGRVLVDFHVEDAGALFLLGLVIVGTVGVAAMWLRHAAAEFQRDRVHSGAAQLFAPEETAERTARDLLNNLIGSGHLAVEQLAAAERTLQADASDQSPWFIQAMVAFGAWMSCLCFLVCAGIAGVYDSSIATAFMGTMLCGGAVVIQRTLQHPFMKQLGLAAAFTGYGSFLIAVGELNRGGQTLTSIALVSAALSLVLYPLLRSSVCRFALAAVPQLLAVMACLESRFPDGVHVLVLLQTIGIGAVFVWRPMRLLWPLGYALVLGLFGVLLIPLFPLHGAVKVVAWPSSIVQAAAEIWLMVWLLSSGQQKNWRLTIAVSLAAALLGVLSVPGVLAALGVVVLGHLERDGALRALGIAFLPLYLIAFYYSLDTSLLFKSGTLIASGSILWTSRFFIRRQVQLLESTASAVA